MPISILPQKYHIISILYAMCFCIPIYSDINIFSIGMAYLSYPGAEKNASAKASLVRKRPLRP